VRNNNAEEMEEINDKYEVLKRGREKDGLIASSYQNMLEFF
jgi:hypothetical protein